jgi:hypothetical protein
LGCYELLRIAGPSWLRRASRNCRLSSWSVEVSKVPKDAIEPGLPEVAVTRKCCRYRALLHDNETRAVHNAPRLILMGRQQLPACFILTPVNVSDVYPICATQRFDNPHLLTPRNAHGAGRERDQLSHHVIRRSNGPPVSPMFVQRAPGSFLDGKVPTEPERLPSRRYR